MQKMNFNQAYGTSFVLEIPGFEELNYFVQTAELPGLSMGGIDSPYQNYQTNVPSNRIEYDPLNVTMVIDEDYRNYDSIRLWMHKITVTEPVVSLLKDMTLHILDSNKVSKLKVMFRGAYPTMLSALPLESSTTDTNPIVCSLTFRYQLFDFVRK